jgi:hypothetical protein
VVTHTLREAASEGENHTWAGAIGLFFEHVSIQEKLLAVVRSIKECVAHYDTLGT